MLCLVVPCCAVAAASPVVLLPPSPPLLPPPPQHTARTSLYLPSLLCAQPHAAFASTSPQKRLERVLRQERLQRAAQEGRHPSEVRTAEGLTGA